MEKINVNLPHYTIKNYATFMDNQFIDHSCVPEVDKELTQKHREELLKNVKSHFASLNNLEIEGVKINTINISCSKKQYYTDLPTLKDFNHITIEGEPN